MRATTLISVTFLILLGLLSPKTNFHPATILVGGQYTVQAGETRQGDMLILFARVKVAENGQVAGNIQVVGGVLEIAGQVNGDVQAYGSDVRLEMPSARVEGAINTFYSLRSLPLVPSILLVIS